MISELKEKMRKNGVEIDVKNLAWESKEELLGDRCHFCTKCYWTCTNCTTCTQCYTSSCVGVI